MSKHIEITISTKTILKLIFTVIILWFLFSIKQILAIIFFALILSPAIDGIIDRLIFKKIPRPISVLAIFGTILSIIAILLISIAQPISLQIQELIKNFPMYHDAINNGLKQLFNLDSNPLDSLQVISTNLNYPTDNVFGFISNVFGGITSFILILVLTFYMSIQKEAIKKALQFIMPTKYESMISDLITKIQYKIGNWIQGQLTLSFIVGIIVYIGLKIIGVKYALILALLAGFAEFIPYIGPVTAGITAVFIAFSFSPIQGLGVAIFYSLLQLAENHILVPKIMQHAVGLNPIIIICALLIGIRIGGVMGALIAIPTATAISVLITELPKYKNLFAENSSK